MVCKARFSCRSPPRFRRWRTTWPEDAWDRGRPGQHGKGGLRTEPARMGPADQQLGGGDGADAGLGQQGRGHGHDELAQFGLELVGVMSGGQGPLGGQGQRAHGGPVLHRIGGQRPPARRRPRAAGARAAPAAGLAAARGR